MTESAGREHVERVVREEVERVVREEVERGHELYEGDPTGSYRNLLELSDAIARHVADRLSVPVLSEDDVAHLVRLRCWFEVGCEPDHIRPGIALLDRLIDAGKP